MRAGEEVRLEVVLSVGDGRPGPEGTAWLAADASAWVSTVAFGIPSDLPREAAHETST